MVEDQMGIFGIIKTVIWAGLPFKMVVNMEHAEHSQDLDR